MGQDGLAVDVVLRLSVQMSEDVSLGNYEFLKLMNHTASLDEDLPEAAELLRNKWDMGV
jgi:hypothetical protein